MNQVDLLRQLQQLARQYGKRVFTLREIASLSDLSHPAAGMLLLRAEKKGLVGQAGRGWFNRLDPPSLPELALALVTPSYVSFESALYHHGLLSQSPRGELTVAITGRPRQIETPLGVIRLIHLKPELFFGYTQDRIASPEKAWLDFLYIHYRKDARFVPTVELDLGRLNRRKLLELGQRFPAWLRKSMRR